MPKRGRVEASSKPQPQTEGTAAEDGAHAEADGAGVPLFTMPDKPNRPPTAFEERLYQLCKCIPAGKVSTYGAMATVLQSAPRAVGQALRRNPFCPVVPCHRVVAADLNIGGFSGCWGISDPKVQRKRKLLEGEGVGFDAAAPAGACKVLREFVLGPEELRGRQAAAKQGRAAGPGEVLAGEAVTVTGATGKAQAAGARERAAGGGRSGRKAA